MFKKYFIVCITAIIIGLLTACATPQAITPTSSGQMRTYYIAAEEVDWDYAPNYPKNPMMGMDFMDEDEGQVFLKNGPDRIGHIYRKAVFREYTDESFSKQKPIAAEWQHLGLLGPAIRAEVGDTIKVVFKNNATFPYGIHPHGVFYKKDSEGSPYEDGTSGADKADDSVPPGKMHTYNWEVPERAGPGPNDPSSIVWLYHSHTDEVRDTYAGLIGPIIITRRGMAKADGSPKDVDREFVTLFQVFDENNSQYIHYNIEHFTKDHGPKGPDHKEMEDDEEFHESNLMHSINGYVFGNLPGLTMKLGDHVRWYVLALGTEVDLHTPHWHGNTGLTNGQRVDTIELLPASMKVVDMVPDNLGTWMFHCHVNDHIVAGMSATYIVTK